MYVVVVYRGRGVGVKAWDQGQEPEGRHGLTGNLSNLHSSPNSDTAALSDLGEVTSFSGRQFPHLSSRTTYQLIV